MGPNLTWSVERGEETRVSLSGRLDEYAGLSALAAQLNGRVVFDLSRVDYINSPGVREWTGFIHELGSRVPGYVFERCSVSFVRQMNMVRLFRGSAEIRSVLAPYVCSNCDRAETRLLVAGAITREQLEAPFPCPACGNPMEFDDLPELYLRLTS